MGGYLNGSLLTTSFPTTQHCMEEKEGRHIRWLHGTNFIIYCRLKRSHVFCEHNTLRSQHAFLVIPSTVDWQNDWWLIFRLVSLLIVRLLFKVVLNHSSIPHQRSAESRGWTTDLKPSDWGTRDVTTWTPYWWSWTLVKSEDDGICTFISKASIEHKTRQSFVFRTKCFTLFESQQNEHSPCRDIYPMRS